MPIRLTLAALAFCPLLAAQFSSLTTDARGSAAFFATALRQKNSDQPEHGKLFRAGPELGLLESRTLMLPAPVPDGISGIGHASNSNAYDLFGVSVSADASIIASVARGYCSGDASVCAKAVPVVSTDIRTPAGTVSRLGRWQVSSDGQWAFGGTAGSPWLDRQLALLNLRTGEETRIPAEPLGPAGLSAGRTVANTGAAVYLNVDAVGIWRDGRIRRVTGGPLDSFEKPAIDAAGSVAAWTRKRIVLDSGGRASGLFQWSVWLANVPSGEPRLLAEGARTPVIADDGTRVLALAPDAEGLLQAWLFRTADASGTKLTAEPFGVSAATLSGDGEIVYFQTRDARLVRLEIGSGHSVELIPRTPWLDELQDVARGSFAVLSGGGFSLNDSPVITVGAVPAITVGTTREGIAVLVHPGTPLSTSTGPNLEIKATPNLQSPFDGPKSQVHVDAYLARFLTAEPAGNTSFAIAAHQDWRGLVTEADPARPGEVIHLYATGLGPTSPEIPFGIPTPATAPLPWLLRPYACTEPTLYQGLAPGLTGVYQIDLQIPESARGPLTWFDCGEPGATFGAIVPTGPPLQ